MSTSSNTNLIINAVGSDRLGIVSDITGMVIEHGGNVGESQAARLGSHFSLMMIVSLPSDSLEGLKQSLDGLHNMNAAVFETHDAENTTKPEVGCKYDGVHGSCQPFGRLTLRHKQIWVAFAWKEPTIQVLSTKLHQL